MTNTPSGKKPSGSDDGGLSAGLQRLATDDGAPLRIGARLRNYFLTGLIIVGPVTLTIYIIWWVINVTDAWLKPFVPRITHQMKIVS
nr:hypothetical protein [Hyphomicrobium zavarzinii]